MKLIVIVSDIFGRTQALERLCSEIGYEYVIIADPYGGREMNFNDEASAYSYFMENIGLEKYSDILKNIVVPLNGDISVIGFSVGATAAWNISAQTQMKDLICFYGSRIRNSVDIEPKCRVKLIMPCCEKGYDVDEFIGKMNGRNNVECIRTEYQHGFMNRLSSGFSEKGYAEYLKLIKVR